VLGWQSEETVAGPWWKSSLSGQYLCFKPSKNGTPLRVQKICVLSPPNSHTCTVSPSTPIPPPEACCCSPPRPACADCCRRLVLLLLAVGRHDATPLATQASEGVLGNTHPSCVTCAPRLPLPAAHAHSPTQWATHPPPAAHAARRTQHSHGPLPLPLSAPAPALAQSPALAAKATWG
jgi:hypothetical protein